MLIRDANSYRIAAVRTSVRPFRLHWFSRLNSTNDQAIAMRRQGELFAPAIVLTSHQIRGRGRGKNAWHSPAGALTVTFAVPIAEHLRPHQVPLIAGLAVRNALHEITGINSIKLKWPNDLLHNDRKLGGLLCERVDGVDLIGVGININVAPGRLPIGVRKNSTSLMEVAGKSFEMNDALISIARHIHLRLSRRNEIHFGAVLREYHRHHALVGRHIQVSDAALSENGDKPLRGTCVGLDRLGRLLLREQRGGTHVHRIVAGHVSLRSMRTRTLG